MVVDDTLLMSNPIYSESSPASEKGERFGLLRLGLLPLFFLILFSALPAGAEKQKSSSASLTHKEATARLVSDLESQDSVSARIAEMLRTGKGDFRFVINFDYDKYDIRPEFEPLLDTIGTALKGTPANTIELSVEGNTDWDGSEAYNVELSRNRALAVEKYFASRFDVRFYRLQFKFWGESNPIRPNTSREGMARNRRAEFAIRPVTPPVRQAQPFDRYGVAFKKDGRFALTAEGGTVLKLRNTELDCHQRSLAGHMGKILAAEFSPNGRLAISGAKDNRVKLWDVATGREISTYYGHRGPINTVAMTSDGRMAASGSEDRTLKLWDLVDDREIKTLEGHKSAVTAVDFSPNNWYAASGDREGTIIIWHVGNKVELQRLKAADSAVTSIVFFRNDRILAGSLDGSVKVWEASTGKLLQTFLSGGTAVLFTDVSTDRRFGVTAGTQGRVTVWNMATGAEFRRLEGHDSNVVFAAFSGDGDLLLTADSDLSHRLWDFESGRQVSSFRPLSGAMDTEVLTRVNEAPKEIWNEPNSGINLVRLTGSCFMMGCGTWTENCSEDEFPPHEVCVDDFWIGQHEVTQSEWAKVMQTNPSRFQGGGNYPVEQVSWDQAQEYVCRLNELTGLEFRLLSETEWEYACRSGGNKVTHAVETPKSNGNSASGNSNSSVDAGPTREVDLESTNTAGVSGMNDGPWEWVADIYEDNLNVAAYPRHSRNNPLYTGGNDYRFSTAIYPRVNRGGSWDIGKGPTRCSLRHFDNPGLQSFFQGFRVGTSASQKERREN